MTMRTKPITIFIAAAVSLTAQAQEFSADTVAHDSSGGIFRGKLYRSATMIRADAASSNDGDPTFIIVDIPKQVSNTVIPNRKGIMVARDGGAEQSGNCIARQRKPMYAYERRSPVDPSCLPCLLDTK
jgi:hypothetical protein